MAFEKVVRPFDYSQDEECEDDVSKAGLISMCDDMAGCTDTLTLYAIVCHCERDFTL